MFDQMFEAYRKASESWLQVHQDMLKQGAQQWAASPQNGAGVTPDWNRTLQKRGVELLVEFLNRHRESLDTVYRSMIHLLEQTSKMPEAKSPEEFRRLVEDAWRDWFENIKSQSETQFRDVQTWAGKSLELVKGGQAQERAS
jgi:hypothetical protein